jgi:hypothetical protein
MGFPLFIIPYRRRSTHYHHYHHYLTSFFIHSSLRLDIQICSNNRYPNIFLTRQIQLLNYPLLFALVSPTNKQLIIRELKWIGNALTAAARSSWPDGAVGAFPPPCLGGARGVDAAGLGAAGTGGLPGIFGAPGFAANGGATGFGLTATGGGAFPVANELPGRELAAELSPNPLEEGVFFHGVADPFAGPIPGKTDTGFALTSADTDLTIRFGALGVEGWLIDVEADAEGVCGTRRFTGGRWWGRRHSHYPWFRRHKFQVVVWCPAFLTILLDKPPAIVVFLHQLNDVVLLQRHFTLFTLKCKLSFIQFDVWFCRRGRWWRWCWCTTGRCWRRTSTST